MSTDTMWTIVAKTAHGKTVTHRAKSRDAARKLRTRLNNLPFVTSTTVPAKS